MTMPARPGTELKQFFAMFLIEGDKKCLCIERAKLMDVLGPRWCRDNIETIVDWLEEEARRRRLMFSRSIAKRMVYYAIRRSERMK